jgi:hypothetical protein
MRTTKDKPYRTSPSTGPPEDLPYQVELWRDGGADNVERVLARAQNAQLGRAIFKAATTEHPQRRITLRNGDQIIADSSS